MGKSWLREERVSRLGVVVLYRMVGEASLLGYINQRPARRERALWVSGRRVLREEGAADSKTPRWEYV